MSNTSVNRAQSFLFLLKNVTIISQCIAYFLKRKGKRNISEHYFISSVKINLNA